MFALNPSPSFSRQLLKLTKRNKALKEKIINIFRLLKTNPFDVSIHTHHVSISGHSYWSSCVGGDIRIIWKFDSVNREVINLLDLGGHSGKNKVYR